MSWIWAKNPSKWDSATHHNNQQEWERLHARVMGRAVWAPVASWSVLGETGKLTEHVMRLATLAEAEAQWVGHQLVWGGANATAATEVWQRVWGRWRECATLLEAPVVEVGLYDTRRERARIVGWEWSVWVEPLSCWGRVIQSPVRATGARTGQAEGDGLKLITMAGDRGEVPHVAVLYRGSSRYDAPGPTSWRDTLAALRQKGVV